MVGGKFGHTIIINNKRNHEPDNREISYHSHYPSRNFISLTWNVAATVHNPIHFHPYIQRGINKIRAILLPAGEQCAPVHHPGHQYYYPGEVYTENDDYLQNNEPAAAPIE